MNKDDIKTRLTDTMNRHNMDQHAMARYLGVPLSTLRKWLYGERTPGGATIRLLEVLAMLETLAPTLHDSLIER